MTTAKHSHYSRDVSHLDSVDIYRVIELFGVQHAALQHALKKVMAAGQRGAKSAAQDVQEAIDSLTRWQTMREEDDMAFDEPITRLPEITGCGGEL